MKKQEEIQQSDTPETDAELNAIRSVIKDEFMLETMANFARKLERERDEAIRQRDETNRSSKYAVDYAYDEKLKADRDRDKALALAEERKRYWDDVVYVWQTTEVARATQQSVKEDEK